MCNETGAFNLTAQAALEIAEERWPELDERTREVLAEQAIARPISQANVRRVLTARLTGQVNAQFPGLQKRRKGRGRLVRIPSRKPSGKENGSAELNPESTVSTDQALSRINLDSANSDSNKHVLRDHEHAADELDHILSAVPPTHRRTLEKVLPVVEPGDSLRETAANAGLHASQVQRGYNAAQQGAVVKLFGRRDRPKVMSQTYNPRGVSMADCTRTYGPAVLPDFTDRRTSVGVDVKLKRHAPYLTECRPTSEDTLRELCVESEAPVPAVNPFPPSHGCSHAERKWLRDGYGYLKLVCLECGEAFRRKFVLDP